MRTKLFSDAIDDYVNHMTAKGLAPNTVKATAIPLRRALTIIGNIYVNNIRPDHIDQVFSNNNWAPKTRNLYLQVLRLFFAYVRRQGWASRDFDPTESWRMVKAPRVEQPRIPIEDFPRLLDAATDPRDRAVCALGLFTFCRSSEIQTLKIRDLDFGAGTVSIYRHKTKEADVLPLVSELAVEMTRWLNFYQEQQGTLNEDWFLVPAKGPLPMIRDPKIGRLRPSGEPARLRPTKAMTHPYRAAQRPLRAIGLKDRGVGGHVLRRSGAYCLFLRLRHEGYDGALKRVQSMLGHANAATTEVYLSLGMERMQRNELLAGRPMFPDMPTTGSLSELRAV